MLTRTLCVASAIAFALLATPAAEAARKNKKANRGGPSPGLILGRFDRDSSGSLDPQESERVRKTFKALKGLDADSNGELSDSELAAAKVEKPKRKRGKGKRSKSQQ